MATILDYSRKFEKFLKLRNNASSTIDVYTGLLRSMLSYFKKDPISITPDMIGDWILTFKSPKTKRQAWYTIANFYGNVMGLRDYMIKIPKAKENKYIPETLNVQEVMRLIGSISNLKQRACLQLIYACGLRISEATNMRIADIDGVRLQVHIKMSKGAKDRVIPIPQDTLNVLREYYQAYKPKEFLFNGDSNHSQYSERSIQQVFHLAKHAAGIYKHVTVHSLRHSRATHLLCNGMDSALIMRFLGHSNIKTTNNFYLHTKVDDLGLAMLRADVLILNHSKQLAA